MLDVIRSRRSIRKFKKQLPGDTALRQILEAGRWAPSGLNNQPWRFLIISDKKQKDGLASFTKYASIIKRSPLLIAVFLDIADSYNREKDLMAIGACVQNMLLEAHATGLAACWLGEILNKKKEVSSWLDVDRDLELMAVLALGYSDEKPVCKSRKSLKSLIVSPLTSPYASVIIQSQ